MKIEKGSVQDILRGLKYMLVASRARHFQGTLT